MYYPTPLMANPVVSHIYFNNYNNLLLVYGFLLFIMTFVLGAHDLLYMSVVTLDPLNSGLNLEGSLHTT